MSEKAREALSGNMAEVSSLVEIYPYCIPVLAAAELLHIKPEALRASIEQGRCPFGFSWKLGERSGYKIPTLTFVTWLMKGGLPVS